MHCSHLSNYQIMNYLPYQLNIVQMNVANKLKHLSKLNLNTVLTVIIQNRTLYMRSQCSLRVVVEGWKLTSVVTMRSECVHNVNAFWNHSGFLEAPLL